MRRKRSTGPTEAAKILGKDRKQLQRWREVEGAPFDSDGKVDVEELRAWALSTGRLEREPGRPSEVERLMGPDPVPAPVAAPPLASSGAALDELSQADREVLEALVAGDAGGLIELATRVGPGLLKKLAQMGRTRRELAEAERRELENRDRRGELHEVEACQASMVKKIHAVRDAFEPLPSVIATRLRGITEWDEQVDVIRQSLDHILDGFAGSSRG